jgi:hypothetical protein
MPGKKTVLALLCSLAVVPIFDCAESRFPVVAELKAAITELLRAGRYEDALGCTQQILLLAPNDDYAVGLLPLLQDRTRALKARAPSMDINGPANETAEERSVRLRGSEREDRREPYPDLLQSVWDWPDFPELHPQDIRITNRRLSH